MNDARFEVIQRLVHFARNMATNESFDTVIHALDEVETKILNLRGSFKIMNGDYYGALNDFDTANQLEPSKSENVIERGLLMSILGDTEGALNAIGMLLDVSNSSNAFNKMPDTEEHIRDERDALVTLLIEAAKGPLQVNVQLGSNNFN